MNDFEYNDITSINTDLLCKICQKPFIDPVSLPSPCEQTFCLNCIKTNLDHHTNNCQECNNKPLTDQDLKSEGPAFKKILDHLLVKCPLCQQSDIQRRSLKKHLEQECLKRIVLCHANDIRCPWKGPYEDLDQHFDVCPYEKIRPDLTQLIKNDQDFQQLKIDFQNLKNEFKQKNDSIEQLNKDNESLNNKLTATEFDNKSLNDLNQQQITQINDLNEQIKTFNEQNQSLNEQNKTLDEEKQSLNEQLDKLNNIEQEHQSLTQQSEQQLNEIENFKNEIQSLNEQIQQLKQTESEYEQLTTIYKQEQNESNILKDEYQATKDQLTQCQFQTTQFQTLLQCYQETANQLSLSQTENNELHERLKQFEIEYDLLHEQNKNLIKQNEQNEEQIEVLQTTNQQLVQESDDDYIKIEQLTINIKRLETKLNKPTLRSIEFSTDKSYENFKLKQLIEQFQPKSLLNLNGQTLNDNDIDIINTIGLIGKECQSIILSNNNLTPNSILKLSLYLNLNKTLTKLIISENNLSDLSIQYLSETFSYNNSTLKQLTLNSNEITDQGFIYLSCMFKSNQSILTFGLHENKITDKSIEHFSKTMQFYNQTLREVTLYSNKFITDASIQDISDMLINHNALNTLWIWDCQLSEQGIDQLHLAIENKSNFDLKC